MDNKYIRENEIHEKYILNQLDDKEKQAYEVFLKSSPQARDELEKTKKLIAGIRTSGANNMRKEIKEQVEGLRNPKTDWSIMYKAAAVLFIFVLLPAIFYYQQNFTKPELINEQMVTEKPVEAVKEKVSPPEIEKEEFSKDEKEAAPTPADKDIAPVVEKKAIGRISEMPKSKKADIEDKRDAVIIEEQETLAKRNKSEKKAVESKSVLSDLAVSTEAEEAELENLSSMSKLDKVLSAAGGNVADDSEADKSKRAGMQSPSRSMGMDYIPPIRTLTFTNQDDTLILTLHRTTQREAFPGFLKVAVKEDSLKQSVLDLYVSDPLHSVERQDIKVIWQSEKLINIKFKDKATYQVKLIKGQKVARKIE